MTGSIRPVPSHLFAVDFTRAAYISFGKDRIVMRWDAERGLAHLAHPSG